MGIGIQVEGLSKSFGSQRIWEDVTLEIPEGEVSAILESFEANGSGRHRDADADTASIPTQRGY
jgi:ABC-type transporter Mla maintaining outer membrane lipid asymmetry ATPase subunit MlaF